MGQAKPFGKGPGEKRGLIVPSFAFPLSVEWHGHDDVCRHHLPFIFHYFGESFGKPSSQRLDLLELQEEDRLDEWALVNRKASCAVKRVCFVVTSRANQGVALSSC